MLDNIKDNAHLLLGGALSFWVYRDTLEGMSLAERAIYIVLSIAIGFYGGNGVIEITDTPIGSNKAILMAIVTTIFGLACLSLVKENLTSIFDTLKKRWIK